MRAINYPDKFSNFDSDKCFSTNERRTEDENAINYGIANTQKKTLVRKKNMYEVIVLSSDPLI